MSEQVEEFSVFVTNCFKLSRERRIVGVDERLTKLHELYEQVPAEDRKLVQDAYKRCIVFLEKCKKESEEQLLVGAQNSSETVLQPINASNTGMEFDLKTVGAVVPDYNGSPEKLTDFLDCARLYNELLKPESRAGYLNFLLKVKLKEKAKLALITTPKDFLEFETFLKARFKPKATVSSIQHKLSTLRQGSRPVDSFVAEIESLVNSLTDLQVAERGENNREIIQALNDSTALNTLKAGCKEEVKRVILASQVANFPDGVTLALDAESSLAITSEQPAQVNYVRRGYHGRGRGHYRGRGKWRQNHNNHNSYNSYNNGNKYRNNGDSNGNANGSYAASYDGKRGKNGNNGYRGRGQSRGQHRDHSGNGQAPPEARNNVKQVSVVAAEERNASIYV